LLWGVLLPGCHDGLPKCPERSAGQAPEELRCQQPFQRLPSQRPGPAARLGRHG